MKLPMSISKREMALRLHASIDSDFFKSRLSSIHRHFPNLKNEGRYRDALLEAFNMDPRREEDDLLAYAEVNKVDLVVCPAEGAHAQHLRVEIKYHFTYDFYARVRRDLPAFAESGLTKERGDLAAIAKDWIGKESDMFILIVQDRFAASYGEVHPGSKKDPMLYERGVKLHFLHEQAMLDAQYSDRARNRDAWSSPLREMLEHFQRARPFEPLKEYEIEVVRQRRETLPLTSHIFTLLRHDANAR